MFDLAGENLKYNANITNSKIAETAAIPGAKERNCTNTINVANTAVIIIGSNAHTSESTTVMIGFVNATLNPM